jgi:hypothetical protein
MRSIRVALGPFLLAVTFGIVANHGTNSVGAEEPDPCTPEVCLTGGGLGICCLIGEDPMTCSPCGSFKPLEPE